MNDADIANLRRALHAALLGYQPMFLKNGIVLGTGLQFFGVAPAGNKSDGLLVAPEGLATSNFGNIYIPKELRNQFEAPESPHYQSASDDDFEAFCKANSLLQELYQYVIDSAFTICRDAGHPIKSFVELGGNTGLFGSMALEHVDRSVSIDIVNYGDVQKTLEKFADFRASEFFLLKSQRSSDIANLPKADLGWSYAVALHQSNPMVHICDLSSVSDVACLVMTKTGREQDFQPGELGLRFEASNAYYSSPFPQNFDVTVMSRDPLKFSLQATGFDNVVEIPFPGFVPESFAAVHACFLGIRNMPGATPVDSFARSPERDGTRGRNANVMTLSWQGRNANIVSFDSEYFLVPHGIEANAGSIRSFPTFQSINAALDALDDAEGPA